ncbi:MAG: hypothetical protein KDI50_02980, partial [Candidatus Competibacteraceae bacterium]|nr:hypothetical protein [Candidatus Competibacteraceae bacterium]
MNKLSAAMVAAGLLSASFVAAPQLANAQQASTVGSGTAVTVPYYTVREGWNTLMNITNTTGNSLAVKVRLRESYNSRDVLDFNVLLSPYDVWSAWLSDNGGRPFLQTNDRSCTVPISVRDSGASGNELAYTGNFDDPGSDSTDRMLEGYLEILVMGEAEGEGVASTTPWLATHVSGEPRDCTTAANNFARGAAIPAWTGGPITGTAGSGDPPARSHYGVITSTDSLKVNVSYVNRAKGLAAGAAANHLSGWGVGQNLVTAQQFPWFLEPTLASHAGLWNNSAVPAVEDALLASAVLNEWSNNPNLGVKTDWVIAFPSKSFHVDRDLRTANGYGIQAGCNVWRNSTGGGVVAADCELPVAPFESQFVSPGLSNITVTYNLYDREETPIVITTDGVTVSPAPPPEIEIDTLPYETNVLVIGNSTYGALSSAFNSNVAQVVDIKGQFAAS